MRFKSLHLNKGGSLHLFHRGRSCSCADLNKFTVDPDGSLCSRAAHRRPSGAGDSWWSHSGIDLGASSGRPHEGGLVESVSFR
jgi:hypothetical protein